MLNNWKNKTGLQSFSSGSRCCVLTVGHICPVCCIFVSSSPDCAPDARPPPAPCNNTPTRELPVKTRPMHSSSTCWAQGSVPADAYPLSLASMSRMISSRWLTRETSSWRSSCSLCCWVADFCQSDRERERENHTWPKRDILQSFFTEINQ